MACRGIKEAFLCSPARVTVLKHVQAKISLEDSQARRADGEIHTSSVSLQERPEMRSYPLLIE